MAHSILIVDDEEGIRSSLTSILSEEGYEVESVATGEDGLARLARGPVDVVLLDVWLPKLDGVQTLELMRQNGQLPMVIMISGHASIETAVRATKLGAFDFIEKPLSLETVTRAVKKPSSSCAWKRKTADCAKSSASATTSSARAFP